MSRSGNIWVVHPFEGDEETVEKGSSGLVDRLRAAGCVFAEDEARELVGAASGRDELETMVRRRVRGEPLEQVVGRVRFAGLVLRVAPGVFVPRQRTAFLAAEAARAASGSGSAPVVVDLCCGVGAVAAVVRARVPGAHVHAGDVDPAAVDCARHNLGPEARVGLGDLYDALPRSLAGGVDVMAVNAPYVPSGEVRLLAREAREHEPLLALDGGHDGLDVHRRVVGGARQWLAPTGVLLVEVGEEQVRTVLDLLRAEAMVGAVLRDDAAGIVVRGSPSQ